MDDRPIKIQIQWSGECYSGDINDCYRSTENKKYAHSFISFWWELFPKAIYSWTKLLNIINFCIYSYLHMINFLNCWSYQKVNIKWVPGWLSIWLLILTLWSWSQDHKIKSHSHAVLRKESARDSLFLRLYFPPLIVSYSPIFSKMNK